MTSETKSIEMTGFKGVDEITSPEKLTADQLVQLDNMRLDALVGVPTTRNGFSRYSPQVDTAGQINSIYDVEDSNGNNYQLVAIGAKIRKSLNNAAYTDLKTGLTNNAKMRIINYGGNFLFSNGKDNPFYSPDLININNLSLPAPDTTNMTLTNTQSGVVSNYSSVVNFIIVYFDSNGQKGNPSPAVQNAINNSTTQLLSYNLASIPVSSDTRVTTKSIYRTKANILNTYYLVANIPNSQTTYTDDVFVNAIMDYDINSTETIEYLNTPIAAEFMTTQSDVIFLANILKQYTNRVIIPTTISYNDTTFIVSDTSPGNLAAGLYQWAYSWVDSSGNESALVYFITDTVGANVEVDLAIIMPLVSAVENTSGNYTNFNMNQSIQSVRLYRSKVGGAGAFNLYYFVADVSISLGLYNHYTDNINDTNLGVPYPKSANNAASQINLNSSIVFSNPFNYLEYPELNYIEIYPDDEDQITGIFDDDNGVIVFKEKSICKLYTNGDPSNWQVQKLVHNIGCDQPETIYKYQTAYFFVYKNRAYVFDGSQAQEISYQRKPTFDSITSFTGSTFWDSAQWYILSVKIGTAYFLLCYDLKLKCWYKFSISQADVVSRKEFGADLGKILIGGNLYLTTYNEAITLDTDTGVNVNINIALKTKDYLFPDDFIIARLMFLFLNYYRLHQTQTNEISFVLTDPSTGNSRILLDNDDTVDQNIYKISTDGINGNLKRANKLNLTITGQALSIFYNARVDYLAETWGVRRKEKSTITGLGTQTGTQTGITQ